MIVYSVEVENLPCFMTRSEDKAYRYALELSETKKVSIIEQTIDSYPLERIQWNDLKEYKIKKIS